MVFCRYFASFQRLIAGDFRSHTHHLAEPPASSLAQGHSPTHARRHHVGAQSLSRRRRQGRRRPEGHRNSRSIDAASSCSWISPPSMSVRRTGAVELTTTGSLSLVSDARRPESTTGPGRATRIPPANPFLGGSGDLKEMLAQRRCREFLCPSGHTALQSVRELVGDSRPENHDLRVDRCQGFRSQSADERCRPLAGADGLPVPKRNPSPSALVSVK